MGKRRKPKRRLRELASARVAYLWDLSQAAAVASRPDRAMLWMGNARRISQKARMKLPREVSRQVCKECDTVWIPGKNCRVRIRNNRSRHVTVTCLNCGTIRRFPVIRQA